MGLSLLKRIGLATVFCTIFCTIGCGYQSSPADVRFVVDSLDGSNLESQLAVIDESLAEGDRDWALWARWPIGERGLGDAEILIETKIGAFEGPLPQPIEASEGTVITARVYTLQGDLAWEGQPNSFEVFADELGKDVYRKSIGRFILNFEDQGQYIKKISGQWTSPPLSSGGGAPSDLDIIYDGDIGNISGDTVGGDVEVEVGDRDVFLPGDNEPRQIGATGCSCGGEDELPPDAGDADVEDGDFELTGGDVDSIGDESSDEPEEDSGCACSGESGPQSASLSAPRRRRARASAGYCRPPADRWLIEFLGLGFLWLRVASRRRWQWR